MKRLLKVFVTLSTVIMVCLSVLPLTVGAASTIISFSKNNVSVGDSVTVTIKVSQPKLWGVNMTVNYDEEVLTSPSSNDAEGGAGVLNIVDQTLSGENSKSYKITFKAKKAGNCVISVNNVGVSAGEPSQLINLSGASATLAVKDVTKSANANLKSLSLSAGSLSPRFSPSVTSYKVSVKNSVTECKVYVTTSDSDAKVSVEGSATLKVGNNTRVITVTAPSGNKKSYTIVINRSAKEDSVESSNVSSTAMEENPMDTIIDGVSYRVLTELESVVLPEGFNVSKVLYNGQDVSVATDKDGVYKLYYLAAVDGNEPVPYTYDEQANSFSKVKIIKQGNNQYIVADLPLLEEVSDDYQVSTQNIDGEELYCYKSEDTELAGMYYINCFFNGAHAMYRYDTVENVLQRAPEFRLKDALGSGAMSDDVDGTFFDRFNQLSSNAKTIMVCLAIAIVALIVLIVLLITRAINGRQMQDFDFDDDMEEFDDIHINDNFIISDDENK